jgi:hypothetical protein
VGEARLCEDRAWAVDNTRFGFEQRADTAAANWVNLKDHERIARKLLNAFPPLGIVPHHGRGHWKEADRWLKANGVETSRTVYFDALRYIRENLARTASGQS